MEIVDIQQVESKLPDVTVTALPCRTAQHTSPSQPPSTSKYAQLLTVIEEMGKEVRPTYSGSKSASERLKRGIIHARILVRECLMEAEKSGRQ